MINEHNETHKVTKAHYLNREGHCKGSVLSSAWGKAREHNTLILFDPGSTHKFIPIKLVATNKFVLFLTFFNKCFI